MPAPRPYIGFVGFDSRVSSEPTNSLLESIIPTTLHRLPAVLEGDLDELIDALREREQSQKLAESVS